MAEILSTIGSYRIRGGIARSRWTTVYSAELPDQPRKYAIKVFDLKGSIEDAIGTHKEEVWRNRFQLEVDILKEINHPHIIPLVEDGVLPDGRPYFVMPFVAANLAYLLGPDENNPARLARMAPPRRPKKLNVNKVMPILCETLSGLAELHGRGIVHRDMKPANILLTRRRNGKVLLCDFGMARYGDRIYDVENEFIGSRGYVSPEQLENPGQATVQSDVYVFGLIAYRMLTSMLPENGKSTVIGAGIDIPAELDQVISGCLAIDPAQRPANATAVLGMLEAV